MKIIERILLLSYHELPYSLKPCFLYFGMFPKDYSIDCIRLIRLWIAEGFIESYKGRTLEDVALQYLISFVQRNLVNVTQIDVTGRLRSLKVHDILHDIILSKLDYGFSQTLGNGETPRNINSRRFSIHNSLSDINDSQIFHATQNVRSVLVFDHQGNSPKFLTFVKLKLLPLLRVLDLQDAPISDIPKEVGNLHNLQLLSLRNTKVEKLPKTIGQLWNLQTLDIKGTEVSDIPSETKFLTKLRHLLGRSYTMWKFPFATVGIHIPDVGINIPHLVLQNFKNLQKLAFIVGTRTSVINELINLRQLTRLGITRLPTKNGAALCNAIDGMEHLKSLSVRANTEEEVLDLQHISRPPVSLERLYLTGTLVKFPDWILKLHNLAKLGLRCSRLGNDPATMLQGLTNLVELQLTDAYVGHKLEFGSNHFLKLKALYLSRLDNLKTIEGDLPVLQKWAFQYCDNLDPAMNTRFKSLFK